LREKISNGDYSNGNQAYNIQPFLIPWQMAFFNLATQAFFYGILPLIFFNALLAAKIMAMRFYVAFHPANWIFRHFTRLLLYL
jgi:hypothetical protein